MENIRLAFQGIWGHKMRSFLTMLGIIIGIASIITIVSTIKVQLYESGSDYPYDMSWNAVPEGVRTIEEATRSELEKLDGVEQVSFYRSRSNADQVFYQNTAFNGSIFGIDRAFFQVQGYQRQSRCQPLPRWELHWADCGNQGRHLYRGRCGSQNGDLYPQD